MAVRKALQACRLYPRLPAQVQHSSLEKPLAALLWAGLMHIKTREDIRHILSVLKEMTPEERKAAFSQEELREAPQMFVDKCWSQELTKAKDEKDWKGVLLLLQEIAQAAELPGGEPLQVPVVRAQAVILADHMEQPQEALAIIDRALSVTDGYAALSTPLHCKQSFIRS